MKKIRTQFLLVVVLFLTTTTFAQQTSTVDSSAKHFEVIISPQTTLQFVTYENNLFLDGQSWTKIDVPGNAPFSVDPITPKGTKTKNLVRIFYTSKTNGQHESMAYDYKTKVLIY